MSSARRPTVRVAALLWLWLTVIVAPVGATLHAMSHLAPRTGAVIATPAREPRAEAGATFGDQHGAAAHCHVCDEWQFLDHVLPSMAFTGDAPAPADSPSPLPLAMRLAVEAPWILARAPPGREPGGAA
ncbi:hypothetical protein [Bordetella genomosp. 8]|uniref:hypothetical protein n=1 Tax=Bordetella genomosp. 8 TaxID=1416806 RepID=UPI0012FD72A3|nr:hypothetical protein [Bordetella genomosp. 8]